MGFRREATHHKLMFEDEQYQGLEVIAKPLSLKDFLALTRMAAGEGDDPLKQAENSGVVFRKFADSLVAWNLEDEDGNPVPATYEGVESQDFSFVNVVVRAWMDTMAGVPKASKRVSNGGGTSQEALIPMDVL